MHAATDRTARWLVASVLLLAAACARDTTPPEITARGGTPTPAVAPAVTATPPAAAIPPQAVATPVEVVDDPERLTIPTIDVDAPLVDLGITDRGGLEVPEDWDVAGWWSGGPAPGHVGPAVIAGHVDSTSGPAVFYRLDQLEPGDRITIHGADGTSVTFTVERTESFPKREFPTAEIYGPTAEPTLRLVTCGGPFDESWGHYLDNVVVYATADGQHPPNG